MTVDIRELLPQAGRMALLDVLVEADGEQLAAQTTVRADGLFDVDGRVPAVTGVEYMAQAVAAWAGHRSRGRGEPVRPGLLLGVRDFRVSVDEFLVGETLIVRVRRVVESAAGLAVFDAALHNDRLTASARLTVMTLQSLDDVDVPGH
jgi:predicted hotdog family 3-hydroxylacyl-ACP dehydratase